MAADGGHAGGTVQVNLTSATSDLTIGGLQGQLAIVAQGGDPANPGTSIQGAGGTVKFTVGRNLVINPAFLSLNTVGLNNAPVR